jgi:hypothetical protein
MARRWFLALGWKGDKIATTPWGEGVVPVMVKRGGTSQEAPAASSFIIRRITILVHNNFISRIRV